MFKRALISFLMVSVFASGAAKAETKEIKIACMDGISKADPSKQASMTVGTIVGFVIGAIGSEGDPQITIAGTYVGCETGKAFAEAFKSDKDKAMVLLNPYMFAFVKSGAGQEVIVFAGKIAQSSQDDLRKAAEAGARTDPLTASYRALVTPDGVVNPIGNATAATLGSIGVDPKTAATIGIIVNPVGAVANEVRKAGDQATSWTKRGGRGCFGIC